MIETVLVTGAGGYIGSVLVPGLIENGYRVIDQVGASGSGKSIASDLLLEFMAEYA